MTQKIVSRLTKVCRHERTSLDFQVFKIPCVQRSKLLFKHSSHTGYCERKPQLLAKACCQPTVYAELSLK